MTDPTPDLTPVPDYTESVEPPLTAADIADLESLDAEPPSYHTILEVWRELLKPAAEEQTKDVGPGWSSRITQMYPQIRMQQMNVFRDRYFGKVLQLAQILDTEIAEDPGALDHLTMESDREENRHHYKNMLLLWQQAIVQWEIDWDCEDEYSAVELGAISEVHKMFFSEKGVTAYLDNIGFQFDETDQAELSAALEEMKVGQ